VTQIIVRFVSGNIEWRKSTNWRGYNLSPGLHCCLKSYASNCYYKI